MNPPPVDFAFTPDEPSGRDLNLLPAMSAAEAARLLAELVALGPLVRTGPWRRRVVPAAARDRFLDLRNRLACGHLPICLRCADRFARRRAGLLGRADLIQEGFLALLRAAELFDPGQGRSFADYANQRVWVRVRRAAARGAWLIQVPIRAGEGDPGR
ncbi:MAG: hypothetical protein K2X87_08600, partial [Gemmataceae bacterium]|nr:hypothetical protein [Gemmataceae bacterium]